MSDESHKSRSDEQSSSTGPIGTVLGATLGPFGAAVGSVVDENRFGLRFAFGSGASTDESADSSDAGTTIEIEDSEGGDDGNDTDTTEAEDAAQNEDGETSE